jgi:leucyl/phenylalanyl-tRNA--protein transferase
MSRPIELTPDLLLQAYAAGFFPMSESRDDPNLFWVEPEFRGIFPLDAFHVPSRLRRSVRADILSVRVDTDFEGVIRACAAPDVNREETWINGTILKLYNALHERGFAHSVECWRDVELVGGLYGVALGRAFFGESMFSHARDASKIALVHLVARLIAGGFTLLDTQFVTPHLRQFGAVEIPKEDYRLLLDEALQGVGRFDSLPPVASGESVLQLVSQTS